MKIWPDTPDGMFYNIRRFFLLVLWGSRVFKEGRNLLEKVRRWEDKPHPHRLTNTSHWFSCGRACCTKVWHFLSTTVRWDTVLLCAELATWFIMRTPPSPTDRSPAAAQSWQCMLISSSSRLHNRLYSDTNSTTEDNIERKKERPFRSKRT